MDNIHISLQNAESQAKRLHTYINGNDTKLSKKNARKAVAYMNGFNSWDDLTEAIEEEDQSFLYVVEGYADKQGKDNWDTLDIRAIVKASTPELAQYRTKNLIKNNNELLGWGAEINLDLAHQLSEIPSKGIILSIYTSDSVQGTSIDTLPNERGKYYNMIELEVEHIAPHELKGVNNIPQPVHITHPQPKPAFKHQTNLKPEPKQETEQLTKPEHKPVSEMTKEEFDIHLAGIKFPIPRKKRPPQEAIDKAMKKFKGNRQAVAEHLGSSVHVIQRATRDHTPPPWVTNCPAILQALDDHNGNKAAAARRMGITVRHVNLALRFDKTGQ